MTTKPRFVTHVGMQMERPVGGRSRSTLEVQEMHRNGTGVVHGGVLFTMADTGMGAALVSVLEPGEICATIETKIAYFKPVFEGTLVCTGEIVNKGKTVASLEASVFLDDVLVAKATGSFAIF
ncbi:MAG: PaaI family thioesterase, partial [Ramlibacter sp.]